MSESQRGETGTDTRWNPTSRLPNPARWDWPYMRKKGWTTPAELARETGIRKPTAARLLSDSRHDLQRIEVPVLFALAKAFKVHPFKLLEYKRR